MKRDLYAEVSKRIVAELERGAAPWIKPWSHRGDANAGLCDLRARPPHVGDVVPSPRRNEDAPTG